MNTGVIRSMLLLDEPNISGLRLGIESYAKVFLSVTFIGALTWQFITDMKFLEVVKNLVLALIFMGFFYEFHTKAVDLSFKASEELLREVSPRNIFLRKWSEIKVKTTDSPDSNFLEKIAIPNLNDLLGTALFLLSKVCLLILKLIYTTVYYFTFIFAPVTAVLSLLPSSKGSMSGTITSSLWCILLPFVLVVFLALVGNSIQVPAEKGQLAISSMDQLIWIFGITLLMLLAPSFTFSLIKGSVASTADAVGVKMTGIGAKALVSLPAMYGLGQKILRKGKGNNGNQNKFKSRQNFQPFSRKYSADRVPNPSISKNEYQASYKQKGGLNTERVNSNTVKLSGMKMKQQDIMPNSASASSGSNLSKHESVKTNIQTSKIPFGSLSLSQKLNQSRSAEVAKIKPSLSTSPSRDLKNLHATSQPPKNSTMPGGRNIFKQVRASKGIEAKKSISRIGPKGFKPVIPKELQHEV